VCPTSTSATKPPSGRSVPVPLVDAATVESANPMRQCCKPDALVSIMVYKQIVCVAPLAPDKKRIIFGHGYGHDSHSGWKKKTEDAGVGERHSEREGTGNIHKLNKEHRIPKNTKQETSRRGCH